MAYSRLIQHPFVIQLVTLDVGDSKLYSDICVIKSHLGDPGYSGPLVYIGSEKFNLMRQYQIPKVKPIFDLLPKVAHFRLPHTYLNIFFSETTWLIEPNFIWSIHYINTI